MLLNCGAGEDSLESLWLQGDQTSQSYRKSTLIIHWKDWCWSWSSNILATWYNQPTHWERPWYWERLKAKWEGEWQRMSWLGNNIDLVDMNLSKLREIVEDRGAWRAVVRGVPKSQTSFSNWISTTIFFHPLTFSLYVSLGLKWIPCGQHIYRSCFCEHSVSLCLWLEYLIQLHLRW